MFSFCCFFRPAQDAENSAAAVHFHGIQDSRPFHSPLDNGNSIIWFSARWRHASSLNTSRFCFWKDAIPFPYIVCNLYISSMCPSSTPFFHILHSVYINADIVVDIMCEGEKWLATWLGVGSYDMTIVLGADCDRMWLPCGLSEGISLRGVVGFFSPVSPPIFFIFVSNTKFICFVFSSAQPTLLSGWNIGMDGLRRRK